MNHAFIEMLCARHPRLYYEDVLEELKRATSLKKMLNFYLKKGKTNFRLALNHVIILQNMFGVSDTVEILTEVITKKEEVLCLNSIFKLLQFTDPKEYNENFLNKLEEGLK